MEEESKGIAQFLTKPISRRDFLVGLGVIVGGAILASSLLGGLVQPKTEPASPPDPERLGLRRGPVPKPPPGGPR